MNRVFTRETFFAPAKINWFLHIIRRRENGYHDLETIFQIVKLFDEIQIQVNQTGDIQLSGDLSGVAAHQNLVYKAAAMMQAATKNNAIDNFGPLLWGCDIRIHKNIPQGAGLGGGSSDAATTLLALNRLWELNFSSEKLMAMALSLGADVPFFVSELDSAFARSLGEELTPIPAQEVEVLMVFPNVHLSTKAVFERPELICRHIRLESQMGLNVLDDPSPAAKQPKFEHDVYQHILQSKPGSNAALMNDLEPASFKLAPELSNIVSELTACAPKSYVRMSGSGSTIFAFPRDIATREQLEAWRAAHESYNSKWVWARGGSITSSVGE